MEMKPGRGHSEPGFSRQCSGGSRWSGGPVPSTIRCVTRPEGPMETPMLETSPFQALQRRLSCLGTSFCVEVIRYVFIMDLVLSVYRNYVRVTI